MKGMLIVAALALVACGGSETQVGSGGDAGGGGDGASNGDAHFGTDAAVADSSDDAPVYLTCFDPNGMLDYQLKHCQSAADCVVEKHTTSCCGDILYVGVSQSSMSRFTTCEAAWDQHFPGCGCAEGPSKTEDGKTIGFGPDAGTPQVHCIDFTSNGGVCMTYLP